MSLSSTGIALASLVVIGIPTSITPITIYYFGPLSGHSLYQKNILKRKDLFLCELDVNAVDKDKKYELITCSSEYDLYGGRGNQVSFVLDKNENEEEILLNRYNVAFYDKKHNYLNRQIQINAELFVVKPDNAPTQFENYRIRNSPYLFFKERKRINSTENQQSEFLKKSKTLTFLADCTKYYKTSGREVCINPEQKVSEHEKGAFLGEPSEVPRGEEEGTIIDFGTQSGPFLSKCNSAFLKRGFSTPYGRRPLNPYKMDWDLEVNYQNFSKDGNGGRDLGRCPEGYGKSLLSKIIAYSYYLSKESQRNNFTERDLENSKFYESFSNFIKGPLQSQKLEDGPSYKDLSEYVEEVHDQKNRHKYLSWFYGKDTLTPFAFSLDKCRYLCYGSGPDKTKNYQHLRREKGIGEVSKEVELLEKGGKYEVIFEGPANLNSDNLICKKSTISQAKREQLICSVKG